MSRLLPTRSAKERKHHQCVGLETCALAYRLRHAEIDLRLCRAAGVEIQRRQTIVAGKKQLRLVDLLGQMQCLRVRLEGERVIAVALVNLTEHDERHREVIEQSEAAIQLCSRARGLDSFGLAS